MILKIPRADEQNQLSGVFAIVTNHYGQALKSKFHFNAKT